MKNTAISIGKMATGLAVAWVAVQLTTGPLHRVFETIEHGPMSSVSHVLLFLLPFAVFTLISFFSTYLAHQQPLPSFVMALLLGQAAKPLLTTVTGDPVVLEGTVTLFATLILFQGGLETPLANFRRLFPKIFMLAFPGVLLTAFGLAWVAYLIGGPGLGFTTVILLGAIVASTDPAAVIPLFKPLRFRNTDTKDIAISESAVNDVVGALLFFTFLGALRDLGGSFSGFGQAFNSLWNSASGIFLFKQIVIGVAVGFGGWALLQVYALGYRRKELSLGSRGVALLSVPILSYFVAALFGGSGYLAAFVAGLLFHVSHEREPDVEHYGENIIDGFAKPIIFALLGAMVDLNQLGKYALVGILAAAAFIFVLRPLMVMIMLGAFTKLGRDRMTWNQLWFLSWVRETGAIPAVLLVTVTALGDTLPNTEAVLPIGMWIILTTLILQPPLTLIFARRLGVADSVDETQSVPVSV